MASDFIELENICKKFGNTQACDHINLKIRKGTIHALVGENGAGKSTIMRILFGLEKPDLGTISIYGKKINIESPHVAKANGIGMVHQHFLLAGALSALDHVILDTELPFITAIDRKNIKNNLIDFSKKINLEIDWSSTVNNLSISSQQRLEIIKILFHNANFLILDEPTAVLTPVEATELISRMRMLRDQGKTIVFISHKLKEVLSCADEITVFRKGKSIETRISKDWNLDSLSSAMIGKTFTKLIHSPRPEKFKDTLALTVKNMFQIEKGEILGIAGVDGNGQSEVILSLINPLNNSEKTKKLYDCELNGISLGKKTNLEIRKLGVGYLAEDRHNQSVVNESSLRENFLLGQHWNFSSWGFILNNHLDKKIKSTVDKFDIVYSDFNQPISELSGGNQQKWVVARELSQTLQLLIAAHPTRGVDISAIRTIHEEILKSRDSGTAILLISSELEELMNLADRLVVIYQGKIIKEFTRDNFDEIKIGAAMGGIIL